MIQKMRKKLGCKKGFTLIELIVVIAILGILALIAIPQVTGIQERAREQADIANAKTIANQVAVLFAQGQIVDGTYSTVSTASGAQSDPELTTALRGTWPTTQATAGGTNPISCTITAGVITVSVGTIQLYPTPGGDYAN